MSSIPVKKNEEYILFFDGICNLCNGVVRFVLKRDTKDKFKFATLQSQKGQAILKKLDLSTNDFESFILLIGGKYYFKSTAGLIVLKELGGIWKLFYSLIILPLPFRDFVYSIIANSRYKIFGKRTDCTVPTPENKLKFFE